MVMEDAVTRCVVPLYVDRGPSAPVHVGGGVLVTAFNRAFLFTAAHVADKLMRNPNRCRIACRGGSLPLSGRIKTSSSDGDDDLFDAAVCLIDRDQYERPLAGC